MERELVTREGIEFETIQAGPVVGVGLFKALSGLGKLVWGTVQAWLSVSRWKPDALFVTGGYTAIPVALVCWLRRVPVLVYLPDIEPGSAVKAVARFATVVAVTAAESQTFFPNRRVVVTGYPVRSGMAAASRVDAVTHFKLTESRSTIMVWGGSRGARSINFALLDGLDDLLNDYQIIHVSGELDWPTVSERASRLPEGKRVHYHAFPYLHDDMGLAFAAADLVVSRAGASMLGEYPMFGLGAILVPYPYAWRYQKVNADYLAERGAAVRLNDEDLKMKLTATIRELLGTPDRLPAMRAAARALAVSGAARNLATELLKLMGGGASPAPVLDNRGGQRL
jgi:UDP-N-acetylglucosamine--N-acetylmuramyl-(pentapeptide) pyrophosphoryl-undecaprenol N-acetylglucosamine transferase